MSTKSTFICMLLLMLTYRTATAQSRNFEIGLNSGPNISSLHEKNRSQYFDWNYSAIGTIHVQYHLSNAFSLYTNLGYELKGCKGVNLKLFNNNGDNLGSNNTFNFRYTFITLPLLLRYTTSTRVPFFVNAGPYAGYLLRYHEKFNSIIVDRTADMEKIDYGVSLGAGLLFPINDQWSFCVEIRTNRGMTDLRKNDNTYQTSPVHPAKILNSVYTNSTNVLLGVSYKLERSIKH